MRGSEFGKFLAAAAPARDYQQLVSYSQQRAKLTVAQFHSVTLALSFYFVP
jgi:hypothetical protein